MWAILSCERSPCGAVCTVQKIDLRRVVNFEHSLVECDRYGVTLRFYGESVRCGVGDSLTLIPSRNVSSEHGAALKITLFKSMVEV